MGRAFLPILASLALVAVLAGRWALSGRVPLDIYALEGGTVIAIKSLDTGKYLELVPSTGRVTATAETSSAHTAHFMVLVLDANTVGALATSAQRIDSRSGRFTGRRTWTASGCPCSGFSNAHGLGRFCHPWEDARQESWCYVADNCTGATVSRGSFGRRSETCDQPYTGLDGAELGGGGGAQELAPVSGCACTGQSSKLGFGAHCKGWEFEGQIPWCYVSPACNQLGGDVWPRSNGSFGMPSEECTMREKPYSGGGGEAREAHTARAARRRLLAPRRRLLAPPRIAQLLASKPEAERYVVLISRASQGLLTVEPPPHSEALTLTARGDALSIRTVFSSFERTHLILSLATNSLLNVCDAATGEVCTGARRRAGEALKLLRQPRRSARWEVEPA